MNSAFFRLHEDLAREGPGSPADVHWAIAEAGLSGPVRICDAACGPGADTVTFLQALPDAEIIAVDAHAPFIDTALARIGPEPRLTAYAGDMLKLKGPFDLIWCAGAVYFVGVAAALRAWRPCLAEGGAIAFSEPVLFTETPSAKARGYWEGYAAETDAQLRNVIAAEGFETIATRRVSDAGWAAYHAALATRIADLRPDASGDADLAQVLDEADAEIADWQEVKHETGYLLSIVRPVA